ncbi:hypothetical protein [Nocardia puris]|uniref:hypothetical protein n=1 Tax=Nocardia puris TaxID=208602 RepID=UPI000AED0237|nr:hypothetical protein [Nocardia puris]
MVARSVITLGVSTERGAVHAVALGDGDGKISDRVLAHRVEETGGDGKADVAAAVHAAMDHVAGEVDGEIAGAAVAYRDAAERRAVVTALAATPWHTASLLSAKSAHLSASGAMTWLDEFDNLLLCEVVPGHQAFTLVDRARSRVLTAVAQTGGATPESLGAAVTAALDQIEAAAVRPDAVVLIGSSADTPAVRAAVERFGAPVLPCPIATTASALGAALFAMDDVPGAVVPMPEARARRGGRWAGALFAVAGVVAAGAVGGAWSLFDGSAPTVVDARTTADSRVVSDSGSSAGLSTGSTVRPGELPEGLVPDERHPAQGPAPVVKPQAAQSVPGDAAWAVQQWGSRPLALEDAVAPTEVAGEADSVPVPGTGIPSSGHSDPAFRGDEPLPPAFTPEAQRWWDNHFRLMLRWGTDQVVH